MLGCRCRDVEAEHDRLAALGGAGAARARLEPGRSTELWIADPDGVRIVLVQVPPSTDCAGMRADAQRTSGASAGRAPTARIRAAASRHDRRLAGDRVAPWRCTIANSS